MRNKRKTSAYITQNTAVKKTHNKNRDLLLIAIVFIVMFALTLGMLTAFGTKTALLNLENGAITQLATENATSSMTQATTSTYTTPANWTEFSTAVSQAQPGTPLYFRMGADWLATSYDSIWPRNSNVDITLDLNGYMYTGISGADQFNINGTLTIEDSNGSNGHHAYGLVDGANIYDFSKSGAGIINGGVITCNNSTGDDIFYGSYVINFNGGTIAGSRMDTIFNGGTLNLNGGTIIGNNNVVTAGTTVNLTGVAPVIISGPIGKDLCLADNNKINITGPIAAGTKIHVSKSANPTVATVHTQGFSKYNPNAKLTDFFVVDPTYIMALVNGEMQLSEHTHDGITFNTLLPVDLATAPSGTTNYTLNQDTELTKTITVPSGAIMNLCLTGYKLTGVAGKPIFDVQTGGTLNIYDCSNTKQTHKYNVIDNQYVFDENGTNTLSNGVITGGNGIKVAGSFTMNGGTIAGYNILGTESLITIVNGGNATIASPTEILGNKLVSGSIIDIQQGATFTSTSAKINNNYIATRSETVGIININGTANFNAINLRGNHNALSDVVLGANGTLNMAGQILMGKTYLDGGIYGLGNGKTINFTGKMTTDGYPILIRGDVKGKFTTAYNSSGTKAGDPSEKFDVPSERSSVATLRDSLDETELAIIIKNSWTNNKFRDDWVYGNNATPITATPKYGTINTSSIEYFTDVRHSIPYTGLFDNTTKAGTYYVWLSVDTKADEYEGILGDFSFNVTPQELTLTADPMIPWIEYSGTTDAKSNISFGNGLQGIINSDTVTLADTWTATLDNKNVGERNITYANFTLTGADAANYTVKFIPFSTSVSITAKELTFTVGFNDTEYFNGTDVTSLANGVGTLNGVISGDAVTVATGWTATIADKNVDSRKPVTLVLTLTGADAGNYTVSDSGNSIKITTKPVTIKANDATMTYGSTPSNNYGWGFVSGSAQFFKEDNIDFTLTTDATNTSVVGGSYYTRINQLPWATPASNYDITYTDGVMTVSKAALIVTANDLTILFGDAIPTYTASYNGFVNGETETVLGGTFVLTCTYTQGNDANTYAIIPSGYTSNNYDISYINGTLTVSVKEITIVWSENSFTYDGTDQKNNITAKYADINGTMIDLTVSVGVFKDFKDGGYTFSASFANNETNYVLPTTVETTYNMQKRDLTVTIDYKSSVYGSAIADLTAQVTIGSIVASDNVYTLATTATATSNVGGYNITGTANNANYNVTFVNETNAYTITAKTLADSMVSNVESTFTYTGLAQEPTITVTDSTLLNATDYELSYSNNTNVGQATITVLAKGNYTGTVTRTFNIGKATLTVTANDLTILFSDAIPTYTASYNGFVNGETEAVLGGTFVLTCTYTQGNDANTYAIIPSGYTSNNYDIAYVNGTLTVNKAKIESPNGSVIIDGGTVGINPNYTLDAKTVTDLSQFSILGKSVIQAFDIKLINNGTIVQPEGEVVIRLLLGKEFRDKQGYNVYYIDENGKAIDMKATRSGDYLVFTTSHLSTYVMAADIPVVPTNNTGLIVGLVVGILALIAIIILIVLLTKRRKKNDGGTNITINNYDPKGDGPKGGNLTDNGDKKEETAVETAETTNANAKETETIADEPKTDEKRTETEPNTKTENATSVLEGDSIVILNVKTVTLEESFNALSAEQKKLYSKIKNYAMSKTGAVESKTKFYENVKIGKKSLVKLQVKRNVPVASFMLENEQLKEYRKKANGAQINVKATDIPLTDIAALKTAKDMVDLVFNNINNMPASKK